MAGSEPVPIICLTVGEVIAFNQDLLRMVNQQSVLRERGLLEGAMSRPQNAAYYQRADLVTQAALYMVGIALNHPFVDGNKRTGYVAGMTFLRLDGYANTDIGMTNPQMGIWLEQVVKREMSFEAFAAHLREQLTQP